jgi:hypothetical protein
MILIPSGGNKPFSRVSKAKPPRRPAGEEPRLRAFALLCRAPCEPICNQRKTQFRLTEAQTTEPRRTSVTISLP